METDYIIAGQGLCGTLLSWYLLKEGKRVVVIDDDQPYAASKIASGLINPVTGKRLAKAWMIGELLPVAIQTYQELEHELGIPILTECNVFNFHQTVHAAQMFDKRLAQFPEYLYPVKDALYWDEFFHVYYGVGRVAPCFLVDLRKMLSGWRTKLVEKDALCVELIDWKECKLLTDSVVYKGIKAKKILCCDGAAGAANPYFSILPFALNKGEALIAAIPGLPPDAIYQHSLKIAPWENGLFWIGSSFDRTFTDASPSDAFRRKTEVQLKKHLKLPYKIQEHYASVRPATVQHTPFVGLHPLYKSIGILNGMGAKGCSQAPYFAQMFAKHLVHVAALIKECNTML